MYDLKIVRNYAVALFENSGSKKEQDAFLAQLEKVAKLMVKGSEICEVMRSPIIPTNVKNLAIGLMAKKLKLDSKLVTFLQILARNSRFMLLAEILEYYKKLYDESHGQKQARIMSAYKLSAKEVGLIKHLLEDKIQMKVLVDNQLDKNLLGGVVIEYDSTMIDCSVKGALAHLEKIARKGNDFERGAI